MKGIIRQRGASWELKAYPGHDPLTGKKRHVTRTVRGGQREAQTALAEMVTEAERGLTVRTTATVGELLEAWFEFATPDFSPKTVKETQGHIDRSTRASSGGGSASTPRRQRHHRVCRPRISNGLRPRRSDGPATS